MITVVHQCPTFACGSASVTDTNTTYWWARAERDGWHLSIAGPVWPGQREAILAELAETPQQHLRRLQDELAEEVTW
jgi:hypothetical protein